MKSVEVETAIIDALNRTSVLEVLSAQYWLFDRQHSTPPVLIQVNRIVQPAYMKELAQLTGASINEVASAEAYGIESARIHFTGMPADTYAVLYAPGRNTMIL